MIRIILPLALLITLSSCKEEPVKMVLLQFGQKNGIIDMKDAVSYYDGSHVMGTLEREIFLDIRGATDLTAKLEDEELHINMLNGRIVVQQHYVKRYKKVVISCNGRSLGFVKAKVLFFCGPERNMVIAVEKIATYATENEKVVLAEGEAYSPGHEKPVMLANKAMIEFVRIFTNPYQKETDIDRAFKALNYHIP